MITLQHGDITQLKVDAIVNAANTSLLGGGGVDGAIHRAGGRAIMEECQAIRDRQGGCAVGEAVITTAGLLQARHVIHTVGPVWRGGDQDEKTLLASAYRNSMTLADEHQLKSIAFPNISTGIYGFPKIPAAEIALATVRSCLSMFTQIREVIFVCFDKENYDIYHQLMEG